MEWNSAYVCGGVTSLILACIYMWNQTLGLDILTMVLSLVSMIYVWTNGWNTEDEKCEDTLKVLDKIESEAKEREEIEAKKKENKSDKMKNAAVAHQEEEEDKN